MTYPKYLNHPKNHKDLCLQGRELKILALVYFEICPINRVYLIAPE